MLQYLYTYEILNWGLATSTSYQLIVIGDKYQLEEIRDTGIQNITREVSSLTPNDGQWAAKWYPQISQLQQNGTQSLKRQLADAIVKHARGMIKNDAMRELIANDGSLAVLLVERLATAAPPAPPMFGMPPKPVSNLFNNELRSEGAAAKTPSLFGSGYVSSSTTPS